MGKRSRFVLPTAMQNAGEEGRSFPNEAKVITDIEAEGEDAARVSEDSAEEASLAPLKAELDPLECMGTWYVQRQIPAVGFLEAGARNGVEQYTWDAAAQRFSVKYEFNRQGASDEQITTIRQLGWPTSENGRWAVSPLLLKNLGLPVRLPFIILDADPATHLVCTGGRRSWMYILTRERQPNPALLTRCLEQVEAAGFDMSKVLTMEQAVK